MILIGCLILMNDLEALGSLKPAQYARSGGLLLEAKCCLWTRICLKTGCPQLRRFSSLFRWKIAWLCGIPSLTKLKQKLTSLHHERPRQGMSCLPGELLLCKHLPGCLCVAPPRSRWLPGVRVERGQRHVRVNLAGCLPSMLKHQLQFNHVGLSRNVV